MIKKRRTSKAKKPKPAWEPPIRDLEIYSSVCKGETQKTVGDRYELTPQRVFQIVNDIDAWLAPQLMGRIREIKCNHTTRLMHIYQEAMAAWERSKEDAVSATETTGGEKGGSLSTTRKGQCGNSAYLETARGALKEIREIWGADAPLQIEHSGEVRVAGVTIQQARAELGERLNRIMQANVN